MTELFDLAETRSADENEDGEIEETGREEQDDPAPIAGGKGDVAGEEDEDAAQQEGKDEDRQKGHEDAQELAGQGGRAAERIGHLELQRAVLFLPGEGVVAEDEGQEREDDGGDVDEIDGEEGGQERIVAGGRLARREKRLVPEPDPDPVSDLVGDALAEDAQGLGRQDDLGPQLRIDADLRHGLLRGVPVEPVLGRAVAVVADIDQDAEGDEDEAENEADGEAGRDEVGQEVLLDEGRDHGCSSPSPQRTS